MLALPFWFNEDGNLLESSKPILMACLKWPFFTRMQIWCMKYILCLNDRRMLLFTQIQDVGLDVYMHISIDIVPILHDWRHPLKNVSSCFVVNIIFLLLSHRLYPSTFYTFRGKRWRKHNDVKNRMCFNWQLKGIYSWWILRVLFLFCLFLLHQARILRFLEKTKRKNSTNRSTAEEIEPVLKEQDKLRKKVNILMKKQKLQQVRKIVKHYDDLKPWGQETQIKVLHFVAFATNYSCIMMIILLMIITHSSILLECHCSMSKADSVNLMQSNLQVGCRLIQILMETAYIQPPNDQIEDGVLDIRPAFVHNLKSVETS